MPATLTTAERNTAIRPYRFEAPQADLDDLRQRIAAMRWPEQETVADQSQGVQLATMQALAHYWATDHDWRKVEARLNGLPQFVTEIDGLDMHFIHVRSPHENALPLIITHGWPGSIIEQLKIIEPLTNPTAHGGAAEDAFHLVIPSLPGHGFSGKPTTTGWDPIRISRAWIVLMERLGYQRYVAQGGDWGMPSPNRWRCRRLRDCSAFTLTCRPRSRQRSRRRSSSARHRRPSCRLRSRAREISSITSTSTVWPTPRRWATGRRRSMRSRTHRSVWPRGCSITTRAVTT